MSTQEPMNIVFGLMEGHHRSQIMYTGVELGVFDALTDTPRDAGEVASDLKVDAQALYRLMRALAALELLREHPARRFSIAPAGRLLRADHPESLGAGVLLEQGPEHIAAWKHLPDIVREGKPNGFVREFGKTVFEYADANPHYGKVFNEAMVTFSSMLTPLSMEALDGYDFSSISHVCDVGGGHGHMLCSFLQKYSHLRGSVLELPGVIEDKDVLWAKRLNLEDRCEYIGGNMFEQVPAADAYMMRLVLHDWNDEECIQLLRTVHRAAKSGSRMFLFELLVPESEDPHDAKVNDIHMMCVSSGRERTSGEYGELLDRAGWEYAATYPAPGDWFGVVEGRKP